MYATALVIWTSVRNFTKELEHFTESQVRDKYYDNQREKAGVERGARKCEWGGHSWEADKDLRNVG